MKFGEYVKNLNDFLKENPKAKNLPAIYASDPEGNDYYNVHCTPTGVKHAKIRGFDYREPIEDINEAEEVCVN